MGLSMEIIYQVSIKEQDLAEASLLVSEKQIECFVKTTKKRFSYTNKNMHNNK